MQNQKLKIKNGGASHRGTSGRGHSTLHIRADGVGSQFAITLRQEIEQKESKEKKERTSGLLPALPRLAFVQMRLNLVAGL